MEGTPPVPRLPYLYPAIPVCALVLMPYLPFVNTDRLWCGLPRMLVWGGLWCLLLTPALLLADWSLSRAREDDQR